MEVNGAVNGQVVGQGLTPLNLLKDFTALNNP